ncbi:sugar ABC transporter substrate-binding protein [Cellulomonas sp. McL0617]|uniref:sugar ABC transporter substrate-binding protein n=1 Tax=Cellulomonas sp. McL0617 TaxID=3415675 RepID=UPI003CFAD9BF
MSTFRGHHKRTLSGLAVGVTALLLAACSGGSDTPSSSQPAGGSSSAASTLPKTLLFSPIGLQVPAMKGLSEGVTGYGKSQGWEVVVQDPSLDPTKQAQQVTEVLESGRAGAAWIIAIAPKSMADVLKSAQGKGIPVLINGVPADYGFDGPQAGISFDTIDYAAGGTALGDQLGKCITQKMGGKAQVIYGESAPGTAGKKESDDAFLAALKKAAPGATVVQNWTLSDRAASQTDVGNILQGKPDVNAVAAANDEGALGAIGAFKAAGRDLPCIAEFGGNDEVLALVKDGTIFASVALQFGDDMTQSFDTLVKMQADPTAEGPILTVPQKVITKDS